jgi:predicted nucleic acid-binding protein
VIFVDTSFWVALRLRRDSRHAEAVALLDVSSGEPLITSNQVRGETWTFLRARDGRRGAVAYFEMLDETSRVRVDRIDERLEDEALGWLRQHDEREYSFVDATSFALMRSLRITDAFAFDGDFAAAGFVELRP